MSDKLEVNVELVITDKDIEDILTTAFEGGINYWVSSICPRTGKWIKGGEFRYNVFTDNRDIKIELDDSDGEEGDLYLTKEGILKGIKHYIEDGYAYSSDLISKDGIDTGYVDAEVADVIVQIALFGETVYG